MATIIQREVIVGPDGRIEISAPELMPGERVTVIVERRVPLAPAGKRPASEILAEAPGHLEFQTAEEVDEYIQQERDSWDQ